MAKICISKSTHLSCKVKWVDHLAAKGDIQLHCSWDPLVCFVVIILNIKKVPYVL